MTTKALRTRARGVARYVPQPVKKPVKQIIGWILRRPYSSTPIPSQFPDWGTILQRDAVTWNTARAAGKKGPRVLIATSVGGFTPGVILESMLAVALTLRGAQVHLLLCDGALTACLQAVAHDFPDLAEFAQFGPSHKLCKTCFPAADQLYHHLGLPVHHYNHLITTEERKQAIKIALETPLSQIPEYRLEGLAVGEHAVAGTLRFYARGDLDGEPQSEAILRRYFNGSMLTAYMASRLLEKFQFASLCANHGIYVPQGVLGEAARRTNTRVVNWNAAYRKQCFIFSQHDTYHHTLLDESSAHWENMRWTTAIESQILDYLKSRWRGTNDWIWFNTEPQEELSVIAAELGVDFTRPCIGMLPNILWDAQLFYKGNAFPSMLEWTLQTIRYFAGRPELQLIIRVHPGEIRNGNPTRQPVLAEIRRAFPNLPPNVFIIPPESTISTYTAMLHCNAVLIYGTKTGLELACAGVPVVVAGEAWVRNKGFTLDASAPEEYFQILSRLPLAGQLDEATTQRARKYAYHFFFRRMIPLEMMQPTSAWPPYSVGVSGLDDLRPGRSRGLDLICDGILAGSDFIYPAEAYLESGAAQ